MLLEIDDISGLVLKIQVSCKGSLVFDLNSDVGPGSSVLEIVSENSQVFSEHSSCGATTTEGSLVSNKTGCVAGKVLVASNSAIADVKNGSSPRSEGTGSVCEGSEMWMRDDGGEDCTASKLFLVSGISGTSNGIPSVSPDVGVLKRNSTPGGTNGNEESKEIGGVREGSLESEAIGDIDRSVSETLHDDAKEFFLPEAASCSKEVSSVSETASFVNEDSSVWKTATCAGEGSPAQAVA